VAVTQMAQQQRGGAGGRGGGGGRGVVGGGFGQAGKFQDPYERLFPGKDVSVNAGCWL
jgi:hypothetical protein